MNPLYHRVSRLLLVCALTACGGSAEEPDGTVASDTLDPRDGADVEPDVAPETPRRVLFIGNSYTYVNDLPAVVSALGEATPGAHVVVESIAEGGASLSTHWANDTTRERVASVGFDVVVLQGQSVEPIVSVEEFLHFAFEWGKAVDASGAQAVWYATWARRAGDALYPSLGDPASMTAALEQRYRMAAQSYGDVLARVGAAWQLALAELPAIDLYDPDGSHPSAAGTLLSACVILQAISGVTPTVPDPAPLGLAHDTAVALCAIAPRVRCPEGTDFCDGVCVDVQWNAQHCGVCGHSCGADDPCRQGQCGCVDYPAGFTGCAQACVDLSSDPLHCGTCDVHCAAGEVCSEGTCACPAAAPLEPSMRSILHNDCFSQDTSGSAACRESAHTYCTAFDCFSSGLGPPSGHAPVIQSLLCLAGQVHTTTLVELSALEPSCDGSNLLGQACATAIHERCAALGETTGFGPVASDGDTLTITCLPNATLLTTDLEGLAPFASRCIADPETCSVASWSFCVDAGHIAGFGPVVADGDTRVVVCVDP